LARLFEHRIRISESSGIKRHHPAPPQPQPSPTTVLIINRQFDGTYAQWFVFFSFIPTSLSFHQSFFFDLFADFFPSQLANLLLAEDRLNEKIPQLYASGGKAA
jgi:hypothetical protein